MRLSGIIILGFILPACGPSQSVLDQVREEGRLRVLTRNSPTTYYYGPEGPTGLEFELVRMFAESIGVVPEFVVADNLREIIPAIARGEAHLAAAGITVTPRRREQVRFGPPVQTVTQQVVYRSGSRRPRSVPQLVGRYIEVVVGSSYAERLRALKRHTPELSWHETDELSSDELLDLVYEKVIDLTIADSTLVALNRQLNAELRIAFEISVPQHLAWAFPRSGDDSLYQRASEYLRGLRSDGTLAQLLDRYYGHARRFDYVDTRAFRRHVALRLPDFLELFESAADQHDLDWRLLAAMGYQESHWRPDAVSPTGVRGIMMLTKATARQIGIEDRRAPEQSILGGARYFRMIKRRIPERVGEPDRTWLALAAYNVGFGHLEDARIITQMRNANPDRWVDVKESLPLLSQKKWYQKTRYGYCRGKEPVHYVENIRRYHDLLMALTATTEPPPRARAALSISAPAL